MDANLVQEHLTVQPALQILKDYYGYHSFRSEQATIIEHLIQGQDLFVLMPTGGGKSICYQIPSMIRQGVGIVVSPLIALMEDQVMALHEMGIRAAYYNSSLDASASKKVLRALYEDQLDLLYIAPERLVSDSFIERLQNCNIALFAIDEAHCISQWGHDFRLEYTALGKLKHHFPDTPIIALTATADAQTRQDIVQQLGFNPRYFIASFNRPNIHYQVQLKNQPLKQIQSFIAQHPQAAGIVYCGTRNATEKLALKLQEQGYNAKPYHAGLSYAERRLVQTDFRYDKLDIVVATIAFGMGIDKPNVRYVIHYDLPKNIESYYQETGRAGRDGLPAKALLLFDPADSGRLRSFIENGHSESQQRVEHQKLNHILAFAQTTSCRRQVLLSYFGEKNIIACQNCDRCDHPPQLIDTTVDAQKFLSCIYRLHQRFGLNHVIDVLRGSQSEKIKQLGHQHLSTFGIGQDKTSAYWKQLAWELIYRDYCFQDYNEYNILKLKKNASKLLRNEEQLWVAIETVEKNHSHSLVKENKEKPQTISSPLFEKLRKLRKRLADEEDKPAFMIFSDLTLHEMIKMMPTNLDEMLDVPGIGQQKSLHYGEVFLNALHNKD